MLFEIQELERHPIDFKEEFAPGVLDLGEELRQTDVLRPPDGRSWSRSITVSTR